MNYENKWELTSTIFLSTEMHLYTQANVSSSVNSTFHRFIITYCATVWGFFFPVRLICSMALRFGIIVHCYSLVACTWKPAFLDEQDEDTVVWKQEKHLKSKMLPSALHWRNNLVRWILGHRGSADPNSRHARHNGSHTLGRYKSSPHPTERLSAAGRTWSALN